MYSVKKKLYIALFRSIIGLVFSGIAATANAVLILDTVSSPNSGSFTLGNFSTDQDPLGQSFILSQSFDNLMLGGVIEDINSSLAPNLSITTSLVSGAGVGGAVLGMVTSILADGFSGLNMVDFSSLGTIGPGAYTVVFSSGGSARGSLSTTGIDTPNSNGYNVNGIVLPINGRDPRVDFRVRVTGDLVIVSPVPAPATILLIGLGLAGLGWAHRKAQTNLLM